jgi:hypothetical protein
MPGRRAPLADRFWDKVDRSAGMHGCWPWIGAVGNRGRQRSGTDRNAGGLYGHIRTGGVGAPLIKAHRLALILATGEDWPELEACHALWCTTTLCCNAWGGHLRWGTREDNIADWIAKYGRHRLASTEELVRAAAARALDEIGDQHAV